MGARHSALTGRPIVQALIPNRYQTTRKKTSILDFLAPSANGILSSQPKTGPLLNSGGETTEMRKLIEELSLKSVDSFRSDTPTKKKKAKKADEDRFKHMKDPNNPDVISMLGKMKSATNMMARRTLQFLEYKHPYEKSCMKQPFSTNGWCSNCWVKNATFENHRVSSCVLSTCLIGCQFCKDVNVTHWLKECSNRPDKNKKKS